MRHFVKLKGRRYAHLSPKHADELTIIEVQSTGRVPAAGERLGLKMKRRTRFGGAYLEMESDPVRKKRRRGYDTRGSTQTVRVWREK